jgi:multisubunit Na+/H+ antiporter MnhG subunit
MAASGATGEPVTHGAALAAFLAAGIGSFALGLIVILGELGAFKAPALYAPAGGVTGRTTLGAILWLIAWLLLHRRWKGRRIDARVVFPLALLLVALGVLLTFPPFWKLL